MDNKHREAKALAELILNCFRREPEVPAHSDSPRARVFVTITLRTEDLHKCAEYLELPEVLNQCSYMARRLDEDELETVIESPPAMIARQANILGDDGRVLRSVFDTELLSLIYDDLARNKSDPDHLPLLQHPLYRLWECAQRREAREVPVRITLQDLNRALNPGSSVAPGAARTDSEGGDAERRTAYRNLLGACLERQADRIYDQLLPLEKDVARVMFQALAHVDTAGNYTRRWTDRTKVRTLAKDVTGLGALKNEQAEKDVVARVLKAFSSPNHPYLRGGAESETEEIDVSHEAFIRKWPRFGTKWLLEDQEANAVYLKLLDSFRICSERCGGKPTLLRRIRSLCAEHLRKSLREFVAKYRLTDRGETWAGLHGHSQSEYRQTVEYYHASKKLARAGWGLIGFTGLFAVAAMIFAVALNTQSELFEAEANFFQPFGVAARMDRPRENITGRDPSERYRYALWEGAVALRALQTHSAAGNRGNFLANEKNRLRIARAERLALSTVNEASEALLSLPVWELGGEPAGGGDNLDEVKLDEVSADDDECLKAVIAKEFNWPADALVKRSVSPKQDGLPERRLYFNPDPKRPFELAVASLAEGRGPKDCRFIATLGDAPGSELRYVDPKQRFYAVSRVVEEDREGRPLKHRYRFTSIHWGLRECTRDGTPCGSTSSAGSGAPMDLAWSAKRGAFLDFTFNSWQGLYAFPGNELIRLGENIEPKYLAVGTPSVDFLKSRGFHGNGESCPKDIAFKIKPKGGSTDNATDAGSERTGKGDSNVKFSGYTACTELNDKRLGTLLAAARHNINADGGIDGQIIEVWRYDEEIGPEGAKILEYPIARTTVDAPTIIRLEFVEGDSDLVPGHGELSVGFGTVDGDLSDFNWTWGEKALLDRACGLLKQFSKEQICKLHYAVDQHSAFFKEVSRAEDGIIKRNNAPSNVCKNAIEVTVEDCNAMGLQQSSSAVAKWPRDLHAPRSAAR